MQVAKPKKGYKLVKTSFGKYEEIPEEWTLTNLGNSCDILDSKRIPLNGSERMKIQGDIPYYGANGIQGYVNKHLFDQDLILVAEDGGNFTEYETKPIAYVIHGKSWVNNHAHILAPKKGYDLNWVFYSLVHKNIIPWVNGTTRSKLNQSELKKIEINSPQLPEQQKITSILSNVDDTLQKTNQIIEQTQRLKTGMMQKLLTRGIGHTKFKKVKWLFGKQLEIPEEWEVVRINQTIKNKKDIRTGPFGSSLKKDSYTSSGFKIYGQENVIPDNFDIGNYYISAEKFDKMKQYEIKSGDILISLVGTHSKISLVPDNIERGIINPRLLKITFDKSKIFPQFMKIFLNSNLITEQIISFFTWFNYGYFEY